MWHCATEMRIYLSLLCWENLYCYFFSTRKKSASKDLGLFFHTDVTIHGPMISFFLSLHVPSIPSLLIPAYSLSSREQLNVCVSIQQSSLS